MSIVIVLAKNMYSYPNKKRNLLVLQCMDFECVCPLDITKIKTPPLRNCFI